MIALMHWLKMGGYATYVWSAYGIVGVVLLMNLLTIKRQQKRTYKKLQQWFKKQ